MWTDLKAALRVAVIWGVQAGMALLIVGLCLSWLIQDYLVTRQRAINGQQAYEYLLQREQQKAPDGP